MKIAVNRPSPLSSIALLILLSSALVVVPAAAQSSVPLVKRDTMLHILAGAMSGLLVSSAVSAIYGHTTVDAYPLLLPAVGLSAAIAAGIAKETVDSTGFGDPQWRDIIHTLIGGAIAAGITAGIEHMGGSSTYRAKTTLLATIGVTLALPVGAGLGQEISLFLKKEKAKR